VVSWLVAIPEYRDGPADARRQTDAVRANVRKGGAKWGGRRLPLEAGGWEFRTERLLDGIGIQPGWTCLDLGCGPAGILVQLSRRVGPVGFVVGVDTDARSLATARVLVHQAQLTNVEILKRDVYGTRLPREAFDFVHARLVGASQARHEELLAEALAVTRPGGVMAIQCTAWLAGRRLRSIQVWGRKSARSPKRPGERDDVVQSSCGVVQPRLVIV
jgi:SAM-dependent methyltransferase